MEAENYLGSGFGIRVAIESQSAGWVRLGELTAVTLPNRLKGIVVGSAFGTPYLGATQVFDLRPVPRRWLALERTASASDLAVTRGTMLVTRSGNVGRATLATSALENLVISDDLLRVIPQEEWWGWIYAYLRAPQIRAVMKAAHYGHIIKHLEPSHLNALPVPKVRQQLREHFNTDAAKIIELRDQAHQRTLAAEARFEAAVGPLNVQDFGETGFIATAKALSSGRRRFDAWPNNPGITKIYRHLTQSGRRTDRLADAGFDIWLPTRFKRIPAIEGVELVGSSDLFEISPDLTKRIADGDFGDPHKGRVRTGWILLSRSGQIYGLNGSMVLATEAHENKVITDDVIRIAPTKKQNGVRSGYAFIALSHPTLGRPLVKGLAYGSSIPHIDTQDVADLGLVRLGDAEENVIADLAEEASRFQAQADILERQLSTEADHLISRFLAHDTTDFDVGV